MRYAEIRTDYVENDKFCYIDTWQTDENNEEGCPVAMVNLDNGDITWFDTNTQVISNPQVALAIADVIKKYAVNIY